MVSSIRKFGQEISHDNIVKTHAEKRRVKTIQRSVTDAVELELKRASGARLVSALPSTSGNDRDAASQGHRRYPKKTFPTGMKLIRRVRSRNQKLVLLQEEKDRFDAMRSIQRSTSHFKRYSALTMSVIACRSSFIRTTPAAPPWFGGTLVFLVAPPSLRLAKQCLETMTLRFGNCVMHYFAVLKAWRQLQSLFAR